MFAADVFNLGKVLEFELSEARLGGKHAIPVVYDSLIQLMTKTIPAERITAFEALEMVRRLSVDAKETVTMPIEGI